MLLAFSGWNDAGEAATSAVRYVRDALCAVPLGEIDCEEFFDFTVARPTVRLGEEGARSLEWPATRFDYGSIDSDREIVIGQGAEPHLRWRRYGDVLSRLAVRLEVQRVVLLGAYLADVVYSRPVNVTGFASSPEVLEAR